MAEAAINPPWETKLRREKTDDVFIKSSCLKNDEILLVIKINFPEKIISGNSLPGLNILLIPNFSIEKLQEHQVL
jgi:hypothetical protein